MSANATRTFAREYIVEPTRSLRLPGALLPMIAMTAVLLAALIATLPTGRAAEAGQGDDVSSVLTGP